MKTICIYKRNYGKLCIHQSLMREKGECIYHLQSIHTFLKAFVTMQENTYHISKHIIYNTLPCLKIILFVLSALHRLCKTKLM